MAYRRGTQTPVPVSTCPPPPVVSVCFQSLLHLIRTLGIPWTAGAPLHPASPPASIPAFTWLSLCELSSSKKDAGRWG